MKTRTMKTIPQVVIKEAVDKAIADYLNRNSYRRHLNETSSKVITLYHGGDCNDDLFYHGEIWLTDEPWYAYIYAKDRQNPCIWKIQVDESTLNLAGISELGDYFDPYDGIDEETRAFLDENQYDGYSFPIEWNGYYTDCTVLKDKEKILSVTAASQQEYKKIRNYFEREIGD